MINWKIYLISVYALCPEVRMLSLRQIDMLSLLQIEFQRGITMKTRTQMMKQHLHQGITFTQETYSSDFPDKTFHIRIYFWILLWIFVSRNICQIMVIIMDFREVFQVCPSSAQNIYFLDGIPPWFLCLIFAYEYH